MSPQEAKSQLRTKGYCSFQLEDFDEDFFNYLEKYKCNSEKSLRQQQTMLRADFKNPYEIDKSTSINESFKTFEEANKKKEEILKDTSIVKEDFFQIWLFNHINDDTLKKLYDKITKYFFDLDESEELNIEINSTFYNKGCFLKDHIDGKSPVKNYASILIYLNENWNEMDGGNLILTGEDKSVQKVIPEFGTIAMIDLQNFDIHHQVEEITADVDRYTIISFPFNKKYKGQNGIG